MKNSGKLYCGHLCLNSLATPRDKRDTRGQERHPGTRETPSTRSQESRDKKDIQGQGGHPGARPTPRDRTAPHRPCTRQTEAIMKCLRPSSEIDHPVGPAPSYSLQAWEGSRHAATWPPDPRSSLEARVVTDRSRLGSRSVRR